MVAGVVAWVTGGDQVRMEARRHRKGKLKM